MRKIDLISNISIEEKAELLDILDKLPSGIDRGGTYDSNVYILNLRKYGNKWLVCYVNENDSYYEDVWFEDTNLCYALRYMLNFLKK